VRTRAAHVSPRDSPPSFLALPRRHRVDARSARDLRNPSARRLSPKS